MARYIRSHKQWGAYFLTLVTFERHELFWNGRAQELLGKVVREVKRLHPFTIHETSLLPNHLHILCSVPEEEQNYALRVQQIKRRFTSGWLEGGGWEGRRTPSRMRRRERSVWQRRFHEHTIRNQKEFRSHVVYIHMNAVKHGLVKRPIDWPWSTFHKHVHAGRLEADWCGPTDLPGVGDYDSEVW